MSLGRERLGAYVTGKEDLGENLRWDVGFCLICAVNL